MRHCQTCLSTLPPDQNAQMHFCSPACKLAANVIAQSLDGCWEWQGAKRRSGHGHVRWKMEGHYVHRLMYEQVYGPIPDGLLIRHKCDNAPCCNPDHLEPGTNQDNSDDRLKRHGKLSEQDIRDMRASGLSYRLIAKKWNINPLTAGRIMRNETYKWVE